MSERTKTAIGLGAVAALVLALLVGLALIEQAKGPAKVVIAESCACCGQGCECGDCVDCRPAKAEADACKCGPHKDCNCKPVKGCSCPARPAPARPTTVNVICCFCKHGFPAPASIRRAQCPNCGNVVFVQAGDVGEVGEAVPK